MLVILAMWLLVTAAGACVAHIADSRALAGVSLLDPHFSTTALVL